MKKLFCKLGTSGTSVQPEVVADKEAQKNAATLPKVAPAKRKAGISKRDYILKGSPFLCNGDGTRIKRNKKIKSKCS